MDVNSLSPALSAIETCTSLGVQEYVICSGARNSALIVAITSLPGAIVYHHPEERSASYFALGRSIKSQQPVVVVTTSGTAVSELLPSVIEAYYQAIPLVLLTADRPERFRGKGAPQAIEQDNLFGDYAENFPDQWGRDRPLHINVPLEEPSATELENIQCGNDVKGKFVTSGCSVIDETHALQEFLDEGKSLIVIVGCLPLPWQEPVRDFLFRLQAPVLAEATSGLREDFPPLSLSIGDETEKLLRIGGVPASRIWRDIEEREDVSVCSVAPNGLPGLSRPTLVVSFPDWASLKVPEASHDKENYLPPVDALVGKYPLSEHSWVRRLSETMPDGSMVFLGNSQPIREWNIAATHEKRNLRCFACRGANGIDGSVSTFLGLSAEEEESWALIGDLTAIYDLAAPWIIAQLPDANRRIVVINNGGGRIFRRLPALKQLSASQMQLVENPHKIDFEGWAAMWGMSYRKVSSISDLENLPDGSLLMELIPDIEQTDCFWDEFEAS